MNLLTIIGARPQIIKAAAISRAIAAWNNSHSAESHIREVLLHTGQHYDDNMSGVFFEELGIPQPDINLHAGSGTHAEQTARMMVGIERVLADGHFDAVLLYGDTNSTLAGAVVAAKMGVPVCHVEAGLRSFNMSMPEEQNRIVCDKLSSVLFAPTQTAVDNLKREGAGNVSFNDRRKLVLSGDVMYDNSMYFAQMAEQKSCVLSRLGLEKKHFMLATIHRDSNTDRPERLASIVSALLRLVEEHGQPIVWPLHPRTRKMLPLSLPAGLYNQLTAHPLIRLTDPASFFDIIMLERYASLVITDSGGVQKESFFFETPCVILRPETEWVEIVEAGAGVLADADECRILEAARKLLGTDVCFPPLFGDAHAAEKIIEVIINNI
ncbi:MAG: UDP-N-acetylglucosamine 2-epimerase (non-hydrolyzing) [Paludibacteraceae bacterium]|nr:UDP-N-acetylglucosamine 2-epimerase (non-hydrolyzing) [Paludibacteraceae bacterium]